MESTDNIYMDYIHHSMLNENDKSIWNEIDENNTETFILSSTHLHNTPSTQDNITKHVKRSLNEDIAFFGLFLGLSVGIASFTGFISGSAISKTNCFITSVRGFIILGTTNFYPENLAHLQNEPFFDEDIVNYMVSATPNIMRGITTLSTLGFAIGSLWYNPEKQISLYQHVTTFIWITICNPSVFYAIETLMSSGANNLQNIEAEQQVALPLNDII